jgi:hypothetical protein
VNWLILLVLAQSPTGCAPLPARQSGWVYQDISGCQHLAQSGPGVSLTIVGGTYVLNAVPATKPYLPLGVTVLSPTTLQIGAGTVANPDVIWPYAWTAPATVSLVYGTGMIYGYVDAVGNITVAVPTASTVQAICSGCVVVPGDPSGAIVWPPGSFNLFIWSAVQTAIGAAQWAASGTDERALLSMPLYFGASPGLTVTQSGQQISLGAIQ